MADLTIFREYLPLVTLGKLYDAQGEEFCKTLELPWKNNQTGISCIPEGKYRYIKYFSPHLKRDVLLLNKDDTKPREDVEIHNGSTVRDIKGCCLVGDGFTTFTVEGKQYAGLTNSKLTLNKLVNLAGDAGTITFRSNDA